MQYQVDDQEAQRAKTPHHIFNLNILLTHLFLSLTILKTSGEPLMFILIPVISIAILGFIFYKSKQKRDTDTWYVSANWLLAWRRGRLLIMSYAFAITIVAIYHVFQMIVPSGLSMNNFSDDGGSTPIIEVIIMFFGAAIIFFTVLITFLQTGISVYDCSKGIIDKKIENFLPRTENSNAELGEYDFSPDAHKDKSTS